MTKFEFFIFKYNPLTTFGSEKFNPMVIYDRLYWEEGQSDNTTLMDYYSSSMKKNPPLIEAQNEKEYLYWYDNKKKLYQDLLNTKHINIYLNPDNPVVTFKNNVGLNEAYLNKWLERYVQCIEKLETLSFEYGEWAGPEMSYLGRRKESKESKRQSKGFRPKSLQGVGFSFLSFRQLYDEYKNQSDFLLGISILLIEYPPNLRGPDNTGRLYFENQLEDRNYNFDQFLSGFFKLILTSKIKILILSYYDAGSYLGSTWLPENSLNDEKNNQEYQNDLKIAKGAKIEPFVQEEFEQWSKEFKLLFFNTEEDTEEDTEVDWNSIIYQFLADRGVTVKNYYGERKILTANP